MSRASLGSVTVLFYSTNNYVQYLAINYNLKENFVIVVQWHSPVWLFVTPWTTSCQASLFFTISWSCSNSGPLSQWCHPTISSSVIPFSSSIQSFPPSGSFPMSRVFASGGQSTGALASALVLSMNIQDWFPLGLTGSISLLSVEVSRVFSSTTVRKHQFSGG